MLKVNARVRDAARIANIPLWRIAAALNISEPTLSRWLRFPLEPEKENYILTVIKELSKEVE